MPRSGGFRNLASPKAVRWRWRNGRFDQRSAKAPGPCWQHGTYPHPAQFRKRRNTLLLAPLTERELLVRMMRGPGGVALPAIVSSESRTGQIAQAMAWLKETASVQCRVPEACHRPTQDDAKQPAREAATGPRRDARGDPHLGGNVSQFVTMEHNARERPIGRPATEDQGRMIWLDGIFGASRCDTCTSLSPSWRHWLPPS